MPPVQWGQAEPLQRKPEYRLELRAKEGVCHFLIHHGDTGLFAALQYLHEASLRTCPGGLAVLAGQASPDVPPSPVTPAVLLARPVPADLAVPLVLAGRAGPCQPRQAFRSEPMCRRSDCYCLLSRGLTHSMNVRNSHVSHGHLAFRPSVDAPK